MTSNDPCLHGHANGQGLRRPEEWAEADDLSPPFDLSHDYVRLGRVLLKRKFRVLCCLLEIHGDYDSDFDSEYAVLTTKMIAKKFWTQTNLHSFYH